MAGAAFLDQIEVPVLTADPGTPEEGSIWARSDLGQFRGRLDSNTVKFIEATWPAITTARWFPTQQGPSSTVAPSNNRVYFVPFMVPQKCNLAGIAMDIATAMTTGNVRAGLASDNGALLPGTFTNDYGTVSGTTTGVKTWSMTTALKANTIYHVAIATQGFTGSPQVRMAQGMHPWISDDSATPNLNATLNTYYMISVSGAFSGAVTVDGIVGGPRVSLKFS